MKNFRSPSRPKKSTLIAGRKAVIQAITNGQAIDRVYVFNKATGEEVSQLRKLAAHNGIPINYVPVEKLDYMNAGEHEG